MYTSLQASTNHTASAARMAMYTSLQELTNHTASVMRMDTTYCIVNVRNKVYISYKYMCAIFSDHLLSLVVKTIHYKFTSLILEGVALGYCKDVKLWSHEVGCQHYAQVTSIHETLLGYFRDTMKQLHKDTQTLHTKDRHDKYT